MHLSLLTPILSCVDLAATVSAAPQLPGLVATADAGAERCARRAAMVNVTTTASGSSTASANQVSTPKGLSSAVAKRIILRQLVIVALAGLSSNVSSTTYEETDALAELTLDILESDALVLKR